MSNLLSAEENYPFLGLLFKSVAALVEDSASVNSLKVVNEGKCDTAFWAQPTSGLHFRLGFHKGIIFQFKLSV